MLSDKRVLGASYSQCWPCFLIDHFSAGCHRHFVVFDSSRRRHLVLTSPVGNSDEGADEGEGQTARQSAQREILHARTEKRFAAQNRWMTSKILCCLGMTTSSSTDARMTAISHSQTRRSINSMNVHGTGRIISLKHQMTTF